jgi:hypothetical protein
MLRASQFVGRLQCHVKAPISVERGARARRVLFTSSTPARLRLNDTRVCAPLLSSPSRLAHTRTMSSSEDEVFDVDAVSDASDDSGGFEPPTKKKPVCGKYLWARLGLATDHDCEIDQGYHKASAQGCEQAREGSYEAQVSYCKGINIQESTLESQCEIR